jgi:hypothetical protein
MIAWKSCFVAALALGAILSAPTLAGGDLAKPTGEVVLTVTGDIGLSNQGDSAVFDIELLQTLGEVTFATGTPWTDGVHEYTGVPLQALIEALGVTEGSIKATAINDYATEIPLTDAVEGGPILAYLQNGKPMSIREKGPLWLIYPYDLNEAYQADVIFARSIWQLQRIDILAE